jgi:hypothetical protein
MNALNLRKFLKVFSDCSLISFFIAIILLWRADIYFCRL